MSDLPSEPTPSEEVSWDSTPYEAVDAFRYAWERFSKKPEVTLLPVLVGLVAQALVFGILWMILGVMLFALGVTASNTGSSATTAVGAVVGFLGGLLLFAIVAMVAQIIYAGWVKAGLETTRGLSPSMAQLYQGWNKTDVVVTALIVAVVTVVPAVVLSLVPGVGGILRFTYLMIAGFFLQFGIIYVVDKQMKPVDALRASVDLAKVNYTTLLVFDVIAMVALGLGALVCGLGLILTMPLVVIASAFTYRKLLGQPVAR